MINLVVAVDNGGSELRVRSTSGFELNEESEFVSIRESDFRVKDVEDTMMLCNITKAPKAEYLGIIANCGAGRQYTASTLGFNSQAPKTESVNYYRQFIYGLAKAAYEAKSKGTGVHLGYNSDVDVQFTVVTCIPVKEHVGKNDCVTRVKANLAGTYEAEFLLLDEPRKVTFSVSPQRVGVVPEGAVAVSKIGNELEPDDFTLVVDMGDVTVDISLFKGKKLYSDKVESSSAAGSTLLALVRSALVDEGYYLNDAQAKRALSTEYVMDGAEKVDVSGILSEVRKDYVRNFLKEDIIRTLNINNVKAKQIKNFVPLGAGMNNSEREGSIVKEIVNSCGLEKAIVYILAEDLRYVNVESTLTFAEALDKLVCR